MKLTVPGVLAILLTPPGWAQQVILDVPEELTVGQAFEVQYTTDGEPADFIAFTDLGVEANRYSYDWHRVSAGSPAKFSAPTKPGTYAVRFITADSKTIVVEKRLVVKEAPATVTAPDTVGAGNEFAVTFAGPLNSLDYISMTDPDAPNANYKYGYQYTNRAGDGKTVNFMAPIEPGQYAVRYVVSGKPGDRDLAAATFTVTDVTGSVSPPTTPIEAGATFQVAWQGPDTRQDFITLTDTDAGPFTYTYGYQYTSRGNPVTLTAPTTAGEYIVRYVMQGQSGPKNRVLAEAAIVVGSVSATLDAPAEVAAGSVFSVGYTGPDGQRNYIAIGDVEVDKIDYKYGYSLATENPVELTAPDKPGDYAVRYIQEGNEAVILATAALKVTPVGASLDVPGSVIARGEFKVAWNGPNNRQDYVGIYKEDDLQHYSYTHRGNPVYLLAPREAGNYNVRYMMDKVELAREPITVEPAPSYGTLRVVASRRSGALSADSAVLVILDASGSMWQKLDNRFRIEIAREALVRLVTETIPAGTNFAFRAFGQKEARSCRTDLEIPLGPLDPATAVAKINAIDPQELSKTPIAASLGKVNEDLAAVEGERVVVIVTDGEETCDGDPGAAIRKLKGSGADVRVNIVGFAIDEFALRKTFERWAELGGGAYFDAQDADQLNGSIRQAVDSTFEVMDADGNAVASGATNGDAVELPVGDYRVRLRGDPAPGKPVVVTDGRETLVDLD